MDQSISEKSLILLKDTLKQKTDDDLMEIWDNLLDTSINMDGEQPDTDNLFEKILSDQRIASDLQRSYRENNRSRTIKRILTALSAACALVLLKISIDYSGFLSPSRSDVSALDTVSSILPGGNKARIVFADGSQVDLERLAGDTIIYLDSYSVHKKADGTITYAINAENAEKSNIYNTIITPRGGEYKLTMADGTQIAVNASSTLRYPINFRENARVVELKGEAFFDVSKLAKDGKNIPFIVKTDEQTLEVLGTSFNINSYGNAIQTTLIEGAVKLSFENEHSRLLRPNQQAVFERETKKLEVNTVDPFYITAWKNGSFAFEDASIDEVMESISRWYDVEIVFKENLSDKVFSGMISRFENINKLLNTIELTGSVKFEIIGRRIIVMK